MLEPETSVVWVRSNGVALEGTLTVPRPATGIVVFAHGSGSSRRSPRNQLVARVLNEAGLGTLLFDLLTRREEATDLVTRHLRFDIELLASRVTAAVDWLLSQPSELPRAAPRRMGLFGASTGAAAALVTAAQRPEAIAAVVSRGGRPDLAGKWLGRVRAPTLLVVGSLDDMVIDLNRVAQREMVAASTRIEIVEGASHLFEEPGTLEKVARLAAEFFSTNLGPREAREAERQPPRHGS